MLKVRAPVRLVKGFYKDGDISNWAEVTENYRFLMKKVLAKSSRPCIATHDIKIIEEARKLITVGKIKNAEFQFFKGVRDELAVKLKRKGYKTRIYIPYGYVLQYFIHGFSTFDKSRHFQRMVLKRYIINP